MAKASISTPRVSVQMSAKPNGHTSAQYVQADNPPQPTPGTVDTIPAWEKRLVSEAEDIRDEFINSGVEPGGLMFLAWGKDSSTRLRILPSGMRVASAAAILRGLALQLENSAAQSKRVGELIEESKFNG